MPPLGIRTGVGYDGEFVILGAWCKTCRQESMPLDDGRCGWCGTNLGATLDAIKPKVEKRMGIPTAITEPILAEARVLYESGLSFSQVAERIWPRTTYKTEKSCAQSLYSLFVQRGWPRRSQREVTIARNFKHGRKVRAIEGTEAAYEYRKWLKRERGAYRPQCKGVKVQAPRAGSRCVKPAQDGSAYCFAHDPARKTERVQIVTRMRSRSPFAAIETVEWEPVRRELRAAYLLVGAWEPFATRLGVKPQTLATYTADPGRTISAAKAARYRRVIAELTAQEAAA